MTNINDKYKQNGILVNSLFARKELGLQSKNTSKSLIIEYSIFWQANANISYRKRMISIPTGGTFYRKRTISIPTGDTFYRKRTISIPKGGTFYRNDPFWQPKAYTFCRNDPFWQPKAHTFYRNDPFCIPKAHTFLVRNISNILISANYKNKLNY
jgi:hypothetical protein